MKKGSVLAITIGFVLIFTMIGISSVYLTGLHRELTQKQALNTKAFWLAEAGVGRAFGFLNHNYWTGWNGSGSTRTITPSLGASGDYDVTITGVETDDVVITSIGYMPNRNAALPVKKKIVVTAKRDSAFKYSLFGDESVDLKNNVVTDSYDSALGPYGGENQTSNGDIGSNGTNNGTIDIANNVQINGDVEGGPGQTINAANQSVITGDTSNNNSIYLPPITIPASLTSLPSQDLELINGASTTLTAGNYRYSDVDLENNVTVTISGTVNLYITDSFETGNNTQIIIASGANLNIYVACPLKLSNNVLTNQNSNPEHLLIFSTYSGGQTGIEISNNNSFSGAVYAPDASIKITNNGGIYGAAVGNKLEVSNNAGVHYDEALSRIGFPFGGGSFYTQKSWKEEL